MFTRLQKYLNKRINYQESVTLNNKNIYILPTKQGLFFALINLLMLITAINFSNSLIFALTFFLASMSMVSMLYTHKSLLGLTFQTGIAKPIFCNKTASIPLFISSINDNYLPCKLDIKYDSNHKNKQSIDLIQQDKNLYLSIKATQRGYIKIPSIRVSTIFPLGLFYAWSNIKLKTHSLAYPSPLSSPFKLEKSSDNSESNTTDRKGTSDFSGLNKYCAGESLNHIHWKAYAKQQGLYTKNYSDGMTTKKYWLDLEQFDSQINIETRLHYLTEMILNAEKNSDSYGLKIKNKLIPINNGSAHQHKCLALLALYK